jgi:hypothetical protein
MHVVLIAAFTATLVCAEPAANPLLDELLVKGVPISDGSLVKVPPPTMADGLEAAAQQAVLAKTAEGNQPLDEFLRSSIVAPFVLKIRAVSAPDGPPVRQVDLWFVAHGNWDKVSSTDFLESLMGLGGTSVVTETSRAGFLSEEALTKRGLPFESKPDRQEGEYASTVALFDRVQIRATRYVLSTRQSASLVIAATIDPRFDKDAEFPNQWRSVQRDLDNPQKVTLGPPQLYRSAAFYGKITRLAEPAGAVFVEYHAVFEEPQGWFAGANLLVSKLPLLAQSEVRKFRTKLRGPLTPQ